VSSQALTVTINFVNNAATPATAVIATTGAITCAGLGGVATQYLYLQAEWLEPAIGGASTAVIRGGTISGVTVSSTTTQALVTAAVLSNQPVPTASTITGVGAAEGLDESQYFEAAITLAQADSTFVFTPLEFSVELA
jgi:urease alpha subunit